MGYGAERKAVGPSDFFLQTDEPNDMLTAPENSSRSDPHEEAPCPPVRITLKTSKGSKTLRLHSSINQGQLRHPFLW